MNQRGFFMNPGEFFGSLDEVIVEIQRGAHMHHYA